MAKLQIRSRFTAENSLATVPWVTRESPKHIFKKSDRAVIVAVKSHRAIGSSSRFESSRLILGDASQPAPASLSKERCGIIAIAFVVIGLDIQDRGGPGDATDAYRRRVLEHKRLTAIQN